MVLSWTNQGLTI